MKSTETPSPDDAATVVRSRLGLEPVKIQRFLTGLCHYVFSVTTSDRHWMNLLGLSQQPRQVVDAYTLLFCVVFMSELGQRFNKEDQAEIDVEKLTRLESIFETLAR